MVKNRRIESGSRVLFAAMRWPPETFILRLMRGLLEKGVKITVACAQKPGGEWTDLKNFRWLPVPDKRVRLLSLFFPYISNIIHSLFAYPRNFLRTYKTLVQPQSKGFKWFTSLPFLGKSWDLIYFPWNSGAILFKQLFNLGIPVMISCRGSQVNIRPHTTGSDNYRVEFKDSMEKATVVHCVSHDILNEASELGLDPSKAVVIHPAVDPTIFRPPDKRMRNKAFTIITTGSLIWCKGYECALLAIHELVKKGVDCRLEIIGDGPEKSRILYTILDLGLEDRVMLHGLMAPKEVVTQLQQADAFLLSSLSEGISNAVLEAMSCSLPVVTTDCGGMREAVTDGVEGFIVPVRDPHAMAEKLHLLALDPILRARMGTKGRERIIRDFYLDKQVDEFVDLFRSVGASDSLKGKKF